MALFKESACIDDLFIVVKAMHPRLDSLEQSLESPMADKCVNGLRRDGLPTKKTCSLDDPVLTIPASGIQFTYKENLIAKVMSVIDELVVFVSSQVMVRRELSIILRGYSDTRTNGNTIYNVLVTYYLFYWDWETKGTEINIREEQPSVIKRILEYYLPENGDDIKNEGNKVIQKVLPSSTNVKKHERKYYVSSQGRIGSSKLSQSWILGSEVTVFANGTGNDTNVSEHTFYNIIKNSNSTNASRSRKKSSLIFILRITCKKIARIIEEYRNELIAKGQMTPSKDGPIKVRLVVVSSQVFVEAMRQYHVETVVLTYTNVFPSDIRMFLSVPIYMYGYINTKDQL